MNKNGLNVTKIVLTGGPCAGKTTGLSWIQNTFEKMGYTLIFMQEPATELKTAGITPARCSSSMAYQLFQMKLQLEKEEVYTQAANDIARAGLENGCAGREKSSSQAEQAEKKILIVCDRGFFDNRAYMTEQEFDEVFHLETTAKNAVVYYGTATNAIRDESPEQAAALDDRVINAWRDHPYYRVIENLNGFEDKMRHLVAEIAAFLGEPAPYEVRRRFLIDYPDTAVLETLPNCYHEEIEQVYLHTPGDVETRIRKRCCGEDCVFYITRKRMVKGRRQLEAERRISEREYLQFLENADPSQKPIRKTRYRLNWDNQYYEIDLYPFWKDRAILEAPLRDEDEEVHLPDFLHVQKEVTEDSEYRITQLAARSDI